MTKSATPSAFGTILDACDDTSRAGALAIKSDLAPLDGAYQPVSPPTYPGANKKEGPRWQPGHCYDDDGVYTPIIVVDQPQAQVKRVSLTLEETAAKTGVPLIVLAMDEDLHLPLHIRRTISNMQFSHRIGDAYVRDSMLDGTPFPKHPIGRALVESSAENADALVAWFPTAASFGFWISNFGAKRQQTKLPHSWKSEIWGWAPAMGETPTVKFGLKTDPLNLSKDVKVVKSVEGDLLAGWEVDEKGKAKPSDIGHGSVPYSEGERQALVPVSFKKISQLATMTFPQLRKLALAGGSPEQNAAARALVTALVVHGHMETFGYPFVLRASCGLTPIHIATTMDHQEFALGDTSDMLQEALSHARSVGVPLDGWNRDEPLLLEPGPALRKAIAQTWPDIDSLDETEDE